MSPAYASTAEIDALLTAFAMAEIPPEAWNHRRHLTYAADAVYACADFTVALAIIRAGILRYNAARGLVTTDTSGYHETVTHFWTRKLSDQLRPEGEDRLDFVNRIVHAFADGALIHTHYNPSTLMSPTARTTWIAPDLLPM